MAACHAFEVTAAPASLAEGGAVEVTVTRDGAVGTSQIDVETIDGSAKGGADYTAVPRRTISFTNETSQTFPVQTTDDSEAESPETFRVHLSNPGGCAVNPNFSVGADATVTISANDAPPAPTTTAGRGAATTAARPGTTRQPPSSTVALDGELGSTTTPPTLPPDSPGGTADTPTSMTLDSAEIALEEEDEGGGPGALAVIAALGVVLAIAGGGWWTWRRRIATPG